MSRREFLKVGGVGLAGVALVGMADYGGRWLMETLQSLSEQDKLLRSIASQVTHGYQDNDESFDSLEARLAAGERLYISCNKLCDLAQRIVDRAGFANRLVATITREAYADDDTHVMIEVLNGGRWVVYDLDGNRQPIDAQGRGISVVELVEAWPRRWRMLASDPILEEAGYDDPIQARWATNPEAWYDRVLGVPLIKHGDLYLFHDWRERHRIEAYVPYFRYTDKRTWQKLVEGRLV